MEDRAVEGRSFFLTLRFPQAANRTNLIREEIYDARI